MGEFSRLKQRNKVIVCSWNYFGHKRCVRVVEKITPKGFIRVDGILYRPDGYERSSGQSKLEMWTKAKEHEIEKSENMQKTIEYCKRLFNDTNLNYHQAVEIIKILEGNGRIF